MDPSQLRDGDGVLILRLGAVGDVVRTLPCLVRLRDSFPGLRLGWVVERASEPLLPEPPLLDRVFPFPRRALAPAGLLARPLFALKSLRTFLAEIRSFGPRVVLDFQGSLKSALVGAASGSHLRIGFDRTGAREGSYLLIHRRVRPTSIRLNRVRKNLELLAPLGVAPGPLSFPFRVTESSRVVNDFLVPLENRTRIAIHPGTSRRQEHKRWPLEHYVRLVAGLAQDTGLVSILTWGPGEESLVQEILRRSPTASAVAAPRTDLGELRELIRRCHLFVGGDTGPMHLAWAQGVPVVALFGATDPIVNGPLGEGHRIVAPAWEAGGKFPRRGDAEAIRRIEPEVVLRAIRSQLASPARLRAAPPR